MLNSGFAQPQSPFAKAAGLKPSAPKPYGGQGAASAPPPVVQRALERMVVTVEAVRVVSPTWGIAFCLDDKQEKVKLTGAGVVDLQEGATYEVHGVIQTHPKHGQSLDVVSAIDHIELNVESVLKYMRKAFKNVGLKTATKLITSRIEAAGGNSAGALEQLRQELLNSPWSIDWSSVSTRDITFGEDDQASIDSFIQRDFSTRIGASHGVNAPTLKLLVKWSQAAAARAAADGVNNKLHPGDQCWAAFAGDPYTPVGEVPGYGWNAADSIGKALSIPRDDKRRLSLLVNEAVKRYCESHGHTFVTEHEALMSIRELDPQVDSILVLKHGIESGGVVVDETTAPHLPPRYYAKSLFEDEDEMARALAQLSEPKLPLLRGTHPVEKINERLQALFARIQPKGVLDDGQLAALRQMMQTPSRVLTLVGGPGCGKTALMEVLVEALQNTDMAFAAPTGIAAKILQSRVGARRNLEARTVHSLLAADGVTFQVNADNPLRFDLLVIDETSMLANKMARAVIDAAKENCRILFIGDPNQLQSIEPGNFLADLLQMPTVCNSRLSVVHRNSGDVYKLIGQIDGGKISFADFEGSQQVHFSKSLGDADFGRVIQTYIEAVEKDGYENVGLLMSKRQGKAEEQGWNTTFFNAKLKALCNPNGAKIPGTTFCQGDRIMIMDNLILEQRQFDVDNAEDLGANGVRMGAGGAPEVRVVNGDTGTIVGFTPYPPKSKTIGAEWLKLRLDDGRLIDMPNMGIESMQLSYARTVHKSQGGQFKTVISLVTPGTPNFINRSTFFTAASRCKDTIHVFGDLNTIQRVVATPPPARHSALVEKTAMYVAQRQSDDDTDGPEPDGADLQAFANSY